MKKLTVIRHAKSSWEFNLPDDKRPLKKRGVNDANLVSNEIKNNFSKPDLILSSYAERANKTADIFIKNLKLENCNFLIKNSLYDFGGVQLLEEIKSVNDSINNLMIFGHNNAITNFVNTYGNKYIDNVPTSGFVEMHFNINSWGNIIKGTTFRTIFPRDLKR